MPESKQTLCRTSSYLSHSAYRKIKRALSFRRRVFGQRLEETVVYERRYGERMAPLVVEQCVAFIRERGLLEVGLFRQPGQATLVKELQVAFDAGEKPTFDSSTDVHTVASLLKLYLRELPEPVVPFSCYQDFLQCGKRVSIDRSEAVADLKRLLQELPVANFNLLNYICLFLHEVQSYSHINKMSTQNLATVFGPNILRPKAEDPESIIGGAALVQQLMSELIRECGSLFLRVAGTDPSRDARPTPGWEARGSCLGTGSEESPCPNRPAARCARQLSLSLLAAGRGSLQGPEDVLVPRCRSDMECRPLPRQTPSPGSLSDPLYDNYSRHVPRRPAAAERRAPPPSPPPAPSGSLVPTLRALAGGSAASSWGAATGISGGDSNAHQSTLSVYDNIHPAAPESPDNPQDGMASADSSSWSSCEILLEEGDPRAGPGPSGLPFLTADSEEPQVGSPASSGCSEVFKPVTIWDAPSTPTSSTVQCLLAGFRQQMARQKDEYEAHIKSLEQRNEFLQGELSGLRASLEQQRRWYSAAEMKLRDAERARADADRRNALLQQEMEQFFDSFGELNNEARKAERIAQSF